MRHELPSRETLSRRLQELEVEHDEMLRAFAHDFDASLRQTRQFAGLLIKRVDAGSDPEVRRYVDLLHRALARSEDMIRGVRAVSRPAAQDDDPVEIDCVPIVRETFASFDADTVEFSFEGPPSVVVEGHPAQLRSLFLQLVDNAVRHGRPDAPSRVRLSAEPLEGGWLFEVADNGAGFPSDRRQNMFVLFRNIDSSERNVRVGVGLPLCRAIVRRHEGDIRCARGSPGDTSIVFTLRAQLPQHALEA